MKNEVPNNSDVTIEAMGFSPADESEPKVNLNHAIMALGFSQEHAQEMIDSYVRNGEYSEFTLAGHKIKLDLNNFDATYQDGKFIGGISGMGMVQKYKPVIEAIEESKSK